MAFPYIAASEEETMADSLLSGFTEICGHDVGFSNVAFSESCSLTGGNFPKLSNLQSVQVGQFDYSVVHISMKF